MQHRFQTNWTSTSPSRSRSPLWSGIGFLSGSLHQPQPFQRYVPLLPIDSIHVSGPIRRNMACRTDTFIEPPRSARPITVAPLVRGIAPRSPLVCRLKCGNGVPQSGHATLDTSMMHGHPHPEFGQQYTALNALPSSAIHKSEEGRFVGSRLIADRNSLARPVLRMPVGYPPGLPVGWRGKAKSVIQSCMASKKSSSLPSLPWAGWRRRIICGRKRTHT